MRRHQIWLIFLFLTAIVSIPLVANMALNGNGMVFDPVTFNNEYLFKFVAGVVSTGIGFWLVNYYWTGRIKEERIFRTRKIMMRFFRQLRDASAECEGLLTKKSTETELIRETDDKILNLFASLRTIKEGLLVHYPAGEVEDDDRLADAISLFWKEIAPTINNLSVRQGIRGSTDEIARHLEAVKYNTQQALSILNRK